MAVYLIIGGSSGIGKETCISLLNEGHIVYASHNINEFSFEHVNLNTFHWNSLESDFPSQLLPDILDGVMYCPGSINLKPFKRFSDEDFLTDYQLHVIGAIKTIRSCLDNLKKSNKASIVLVSTIAVQRGFSFHSLISSSKGAVEGLTRSLASEFAPTIRVNCVAPSIIRTSLSEKLISTQEKENNVAQNHPLKRIGEPSDVASVSTFLLSEKASWITGQIIHVDGGKSKLI